MKMNQEARVIERVFAELTIGCHILPPPASFQTAAVRVYRLERDPGVKVAKVLTATDELDEALTNLRRTPVHCRFERLPLSLEVPHPNPQPISLLTLLYGMYQNRAALGSDQRLVCVIGESHAYGKSETILLDLLNPNSPHVLVAGTTGSGKTNLLAGMIMSLAGFYSPQQLSLVVLDPKGIDLVGFARLPHLACPIVTDPVIAAQRLTQVVTELERRKQAGQWSTQIVVVIDEMADLADVAGAQVEAQIRRLLQIGRGLGVHVIGATQKPLAQVIGSLVKANFPVRIVGKVTSSDDARVAAGISGTAAERLPGKGAMLLIRGGEIRRVQAYLLSAKSIPKSVQQIGRFWSSVYPLFVLPSVATGSNRAELTTTIEAPTTSGYPEWLREKVVAYVADHGKPPSQKAVQRAHQEETGQMLGWAAIKAAIEDGVAQAENSLPSDVTQP